VPKRVDVPTAPSATPLRSFRLVLPAQSRASLARRRRDRSRWVSTCAWFAGASARRASVRGSLSTWISLADLRTRSGIFGHAIKVLSSQMAAMATRPRPSCFATSLRISSRSRGTTLATRTWLGDSSRDFPFRIATAIHTIRAMPEAIRTTRRWGQPMVARFVSGQEIMLSAIRRRCEVLRP
jgi:hypothetical protein